MNETKMKLGKGAFFVGLGFTVGQCVGKTVNAMLDVLFIDWIKHKAKNGSEFSKKILDNNNIEYSEKDTDESK